MQKTEARELAQEISKHPSIYSATIAQFGDSFVVPAMGYGELGSLTFRSFDEWVRFVEEREHNEKVQNNGNGTTH